MPPVGSKIIRYQTISSTNDLAREMMGQGVEEGTVVLAEYQSAGRGRRGRGWVAPSGSSLMMSVILRPDGILDPFMMTAIASIAVSDAVTETIGLIPDIKWPNDLLLHGRKFCGILVEGILGAGRLKDCVLGIGLNVNITLEDFPEDLRFTATSLRNEAGHVIDKEALLNSVLQCLETRYRQGIKGDFRSIFRIWSNRLLWIGEAVQVLDESGEFTGIAHSVDMDGALLVQEQDGKMRRLMSGDVSLRRNISTKHTISS